MRLLVLAIFLACLTGPLTLSIANAAEGEAVGSDVNIAPEYHPLQLAWQGIFPGRTTRELVVEKLGAPKKELHQDGLEYIYPVAPGEDIERNLIFDRVVRIAFDDRSVVTHVHIGGFPPAYRPLFEDVRAMADKAGFQPVAGANTQQANACMYDSSEGGLWVLVSSIAVQGKHQVLSMHYYEPSASPDIPAKRGRFLK